MEKNKENKDIKKIVFEIVLIPLCIMYLYYTLLHNHLKINTMLLVMTTLITCLNFIVKYIHEVYVYESKYNFWKIIYIIVGFLTIISIFLNIILKYEIIKKIFIYLLIIILFHLLLNSIIKISNIIKGKGELYKNASSSYFSLIAFGVILMGIIIFL